MGKSWLGVVAILASSIAFSFSSATHAAENPELLQLLHSYSSTPFVAVKRSRKQWNTFPIDQSVLTDARSKKQPRVIRRLAESLHQHGRSVVETNRCFESQNQAFYALRQTENRAVLATVGDLVADMVFDEEPDYRNLVENIGTGSLNVAIAYRDFLEAERTYLEARQSELEAKNGVFDAVILSLEDAPQNHPNKNPVHVDVLFHKSDPVPKQNYHRDFCGYIGISPKRDEDFPKGVKFRKMSNTVVLIDVPCTSAAMRSGRAGGDEFQAALRAKPKTGVIESLLKSAGLVSSRAELVKKYMETDRKIVYYLGDIELPGTVAFRFPLIPVPELVVGAQAVTLTIVCDQCCVQQDFELSNEAMTNAFYRYVNQDAIANQERSKELFVRQRLRSISSGMRAKSASAFQSKVARVRSAVNAETARQQNIRIGQQNAFR